MQVHNSYLFRVRTVKYFYTIAFSYRKGPLLVQVVHVESSWMLKYYITKLYFKTT